MTGQLLGRPILPLLVALVAPLPALLLWLDQSLWLAAAVHGACTLAMYAVARASWPYGALAVRTATLTFCFPILGGLAAWFALPGKEASPEARDALGAIFAAGPSTHVSTDARDVDEAIRRELSVRPLVEELEHDDLARKQAAASALAELPGGEGVAVLRAALAHPSDETRLFASLALLQLEESHARHLADARAAVSDPESGLALAGAIEAYLETGLPEAQVAADLWRAAIQAAQSACDVREAALAAPASRLLARAQLALAVPAAAQAAAECAVRLAPEHPEGWELLCKICFATGDFTRLREAAAGLARTSEPSSAQGQLAAYWTAAEAPR